MTDDESLVIKGRTVDELSRTRQRLACFEAQAEQLRSQMQFAINWLSTFNDTHDVDADAWPSYEELVAVWRGITDSRKRIDELEGRLRQWGALP